MVQSITAMRIPMKEQDGCLQRDIMYTTTPFRKRRRQRTRHIKVGQRSIDRFAKIGLLSFLFLSSRQQHARKNVFALLPRITTTTTTTTTRRQNSVTTTTALNAADATTSPLFQSNNVYKTTPTKFENPTITPKSRQYCMQRKQTPRPQNPLRRSNTSPRQSSTALHMVLTTPQSIIEQASTVNLLDDLIDESVRTSARRPIMMQFDPSSGWIWRRWKGTVFAETWMSCGKYKCDGMLDLLYSIQFSIFCCSFHCFVFSSEHYMGSGDIHDT